jgi:hypothetical protein
MSFLKGLVQKTIHFACIISIYIVSDAFYYRQSEKLSVKFRGAWIAYQK